MNQSIGSKKSCAPQHLRGLLHLDVVLMLCNDARGHGAAGQSFHQVSGEVAGHRAFGLWATYHPKKLSLEMLLLGVWFRICCSWRYAS